MMGATVTTPPLFPEGPGGMVSWVAYITGTTDTMGHARISVPLGMDVIPGKAYVQIWVADTAGKYGLAASNVLGGTVQ